VCCGLGRPRATMIAKLLTPTTETFEQPKADR
jgi:hypothetical protein